MRLKLGQGQQRATTCPVNSTAHGCFPHQDPQSSPRERHLRQDQLWMEPGTNTSSPFSLQIPVKYLTLSHRENT